MILAFNSLFLYAVIQGNAIRLDGIRSALMNVDNFLSLALALVVTTVANGILTEEGKARVVFLRWRFALPGHRAFSKYAYSSPLVDVASLKKRLGNRWPTSPADQNLEWFKLYKTVEDKPAVRQVHRDFLLLRDYSGMAVLFILIYGSIGAYAIPSRRVAFFYLAALVVQFLVVRYAASNYGIGFVKTVLATVSSEDRADPEDKRHTMKRGQPEGKTKS